VEQNKEEVHTRRNRLFCAVYYEYTNKVYLVPVENVGINEGYLRVEPTADNQIKGIRWAEDYEIG
jgi:hypothetical protein